VPSPWCHRWSCHPGITTGPTTLVSPLVLSPWYHHWSHHPGITTGPTTLVSPLVLSPWYQRWACQPGITNGAVTLVSRTGPVTLVSPLVPSPWCHHWSCHPGVTAGPATLVSLHLRDRRSQQLPSHALTCSDGLRLIFAGLQQRLQHAGCSRVQLLPPAQAGPPAAPTASTAAVRKQTAATFLDSSSRSTFPTLVPEPQH